MSHIYNSTLHLPRYTLSWPPYPPHCPSLLKLPNTVNFSHQSNPSSTKSTQRPSKLKVSRFPTSLNTVPYTPNPRNANDVFEGGTNSLRIKKWILNDGCLSGKGA